MEGEGRRRRPYAFLTVAVRLSSARASRLLWYCSTGGEGCFACVNGGGENRWSRCTSNKDEIKGVAGRV
jgi:hypothetical protein